MQPTPIRLSQAIWSAFRAAKPTHHKSICQQVQRSSRFSSPPTRQIWQNQTKLSIRFYSDDKKPSDIEAKVQDAKDRIQDSLDSRAEAAASSESTLKQRHDETIVHTIPESASIVYTKDEHPQKPPASHTVKDKSEHKPPEDSDTSPKSQYADLPSQIAALRSKAAERFSYFMDNFQSQIFVASRRINDLTGYSGIERLKKEIEAQEENLQKARQLVKDSRSEYTEAIANRSATQREVNDLLHRKHAWSASDLERFTGLYRSDHANEQAEQKAHQKVSDAEGKYEDASTKLAKSILARYHEEQIWSDKIRQMSTWGTWGLMGLNILLFIVLQLAIEPWRRRRLVRGFEQKVEQALTLREQEEAKRSQIQADEAVAEATEKKPEGVVAMAGSKVAESVVDAITGSTDSSSEKAPMPSTEEIEAAVESVTATELSEESSPTDSILHTATTSTSLQEQEEEGDDTSNLISSPEPLPSSTESQNLPSQPLSSPIPISSPSKPFAGTSAWHHLPNSLYATISHAYTHYSALLRAQFNETDHVVLSRRELTTKVLEGSLAGVALAGAFFVLVVGGPK